MSNTAQRGNEVRSGLGPKRFLRDLFEAAIEAALPNETIRRALPAPPKGKTIVVGAGKASAAMARAVEQAWPVGLQGLVVTRYGHAVPCERIEVIEAAHPVPDANGATAAQRILQLVTGLTADDLVICLISGGGSALLTLPPAAVALQSKRLVTSGLLKSGATISEINCIRKHLSLIKGGRLAAACVPARVVSLIISDVPGDDLSVIASGPTVPDTTSRFQAHQLLERYRLPVPTDIRAWLENPASETPKPGDPFLAAVENNLVATPQLSLEAAAAFARQAGVKPIILSDAIEGEAREVAKVFAGIAKQISRRSQPVTPPCVVLSGGETTVTVRGIGKGGRNAEFALALALALNAHDDIYGLAADTDGIDGTGDAAGAIVTPSTLARALAAGFDPLGELDRNNAGGLFAAIGDEIITGPTFTNVNDFRAILIGGGP